MQRIIKPSIGAYLILGVFIVGMPIGLPCVVGLFKGHLPSVQFFSAMSEGYILIFIIYLGICWMLVRNRIVVTDTEVIAYSPFGRPVRVRFSDISSSVPQVFVQRSHPSRLIIIFDDESMQPVTLFLTKFPSADVAWLLS
jgi:hypothetical protein